jgi:UrcA family protein
MKSIYSLAAQCCIATAVAITPALAQPTEPSAETAAETVVVIRAERVNKVPERVRIGQVPVELYSLSYHVSYSDLDIGTEAGASALRRRVHDAATSACKDLTRMQPRVSRDRSCVRKAEDGAKSQLDTAINAAQLRRLIEKK